MKSPNVATVFNIQHYCIHDGPGIRTGVFLKGCPLRCVWCANPESQTTAPQLMYLSERCVGCGNCIAACPQHGIIRDSLHVRTERTRCTACGACAGVCAAKVRSISGEKKTVDEVFREVAQDALFYGDEGGLTISGGEAFLYPEFCEALTRRCKENGISTAIETCGFAEWDKMQPTLRYTDHVLYDIKQMNDALHRKYTGQSNRRILENLERISRNTSCEIYVRCPVIPSCNDSEENFHALAHFLRDKQIRCKEIDLLPYHNLGLGKFQQLETGTECFETQPPTEEKLDQLRVLLNGYGIRVK